jgi:hypothetical protein
MRSTKKEKDPCFLFYSQDWITGTYGMTRAQKGSFIELLSLQHQGVILTPLIVQKACDGDKADMEVVLTKFIKHPDGSYYNKKMNKVMTERATYKERQSANASKRGATAEQPPQPNLSTRAEDEDLSKELITIEDLDANMFSSLNDLYED